MATAGPIGKRIAEARQEKGIQRVVVDRGGFKYHGRIKAIVEAVVANGVSLSGGRTAEANSDAGPGQSRQA
jgi:ribosomal protein L18